MIGKFSFYATLPCNLVLHHSVSKMISKMGGGASAPATFQDSLLYSCMYNINETKISQDCKSLVNRNVSKKFGYFGV